LQDSPHHPSRACHRQREPVLSASKGLRIVSASTTYHPVATF
jgi:hypothetical protein